MAVYGAVAFVVLQVADILQEGLRLPESFLPVATAILLLGFPIAIVMAWACEWLARAVQYNDPGMVFVHTEVLFTNVHDDPRWLPFLESIGKSPEQLAAIEFEVRLPQ